MEKPCSGKDPLTPCSNYMESNIAGMLRHRVFIERGKRGGATKLLLFPSPEKAGIVLFKNNCKTKDSGSLANSCVFRNNELFFSSTKLC